MGNLGITHKSNYMIMRTFNQFYNDSVYIFDVNPL